MKHAMILLAGALLAAMSQLAIAASGDAAKARVVGGPPNEVQYL